MLSAAGSNIGRQFRFVFVKKTTRREEEPEDDDGDEDGPSPSVATAAAAFAAIFFALFASPMMLFSFSSSFSSSEPSPPSPSSWRVGYSGRPRSSMPIARKYATKSSCPPWHAKCRQCEGQLCIKCARGSQPNSSMSMRAVSRWPLWTAVISAVPWRLHRSTWQTSAALGGLRGVSFFSDSSPFSASSSPQKPTGPSPRPAAVSPSTAFRSQSRLLPATTSSLNTARIGSLNKNRTHSVCPSSAAM